jgi:hypothetical protein
VREKSFPCVLSQGRTLFGAKQKTPHPLYVLCAVCHILVPPARFRVRTLQMPNILSRFVHFLKPTVAWTLVVYAESFGANYRRPIIHHNLFRSELVNERTAVCEKKRGFCVPVTWKAAIFVDCPRVCPEPSDSECRCLVTTYPIQHFPLGYHPPSSCPYISPQSVRPRYLGLTAIPGVPDTLRWMSARFLRPSERTEPVQDHNGASGQTVFPAISVPTQPPGREESISTSRFRRITRIPSWVRGRSSETMPTSSTPSALAPRRHIRSTPRLTPPSPATR